MGLIKRILTPDWDDGKDNPPGYVPSLAPHYFFVFFQAVFILGLLAFGFFIVYIKYYFAVSGYLNSSLFPSTAVATCGAVPCYLQPDVFSARGFEWRKGDVVVASGIHQGDTIVLNMVHQLRSHGNTSFDDILTVASWLEYAEYPRQNITRRLRRNDRLESLRNVSYPHPFRLFKTHMGAAAADTKDGYTYLNSNVSLSVVHVTEGVRYIVPVRGGARTAMLAHAVHNHYNPRTVSMWAGYPPPEPSFENYFQEYFMGLNVYHGFLRAWLPHRGRPNVLFLHLSDLRANPEATLERVARFLGVEVPPEAWPKVVEQSTLEWMLREENLGKWDGPHTTGQYSKRVNHFRMMQEGTLKAESEVEEEPRLPPAMQGLWEERHAAELPDAALREWCDKGGALPGALHDAAALQ